MPAVLLAVTAAAAVPRLEVTVNGVDDALRENVMALLSIAREQDSERLGKARVNALHERAEDEIGRALAAFGYYDPTIRSSLDTSGDTWTAAYVISPGKPVRIRQFDVRVSGEGSDDAAFAQVIAGSSLGPGEVFNHGAWETLKRDLARVAGERGYFDARFAEAAVAVTREAGTADARLVYASGPRYRFGEMQLPDTVIDADLLQRYARIPAGEPYLSERLIGVQQALTNTDFFANVQVTPLATDPDTLSVPVRLEVTPRPPQKYSIGGGFGTDTGPRARAAWQRRYLFGRGHSASADLRLSTVASSLTGRYTIPYRDPRVDRLGFTVGLLNEDTDVSDSQRLNFGVSNTTLRLGWQETLAIDYQVERFDVGDDIETKGLLLPSGRWSRTWADDRVYADRGLRLNLAVSGAHTAALSDVSFLRLRGDAKWVRRLSEDGRFIMRADVGAALVSDFDDLPVTQRFFAGGDNSLRGFDFRSLGPRDSAGDVIGGRYLAVGSIEYEHRVRGNWSAAVFSDFGNAFDDFGDGMEYSVGAGVRWLSPVGLLRVDLATGVSDDDLPIRLHIVVGPDF